MNFHLNRTGTETVWMAADADLDDTWCLWIAKVSSTALENITKITPGIGRYEDPKFSYDGTKIIFKKDWTCIASIDRKYLKINGCDQNPPQIPLLNHNAETSMPYFIGKSNRDFLFMQGARNESCIMKCVRGNVPAVVYDQQNTQEYYPISIDSKNFYYVKGVSGALPDQIFKGTISGSNPIAAAFNSPAYELADPCVLNSKWLAYSSNRPPSRNYDIWIGNFYTGETYNLNEWKLGLNGQNSDLGATFRGTVR